MKYKELHYVNLVKRMCKNIDTNLSSYDKDLLQDCKILKNKLNIRLNIVVIIHW